MGVSQTRMTSEAHPTLSEALVRLWDKLPSLLKTLIPAVGALSIVLAPATLLISSRFYAFTDSNLRADHERVLGQIGSAFDELFSSSTVYLADLANNDVIKACAVTGCTDDASEAKTVFTTELTAKSRSANYIEMGFIDLTGHETSRALVGNGGVVDSPGEGALFSTDPAPLVNADIGQPYIFPITRDPPPCVFRSLSGACPTHHDAGFCVRSAPGLYHSGDSDR